jgi:translation initiation factor eIF-2B subunit delta
LSRRRWQVIAKDGASKINNGDVVMTHARSHVVEMIIKQAYDEKKDFRVIVVDSRPKLEGACFLHHVSVLLKPSRCVFVSAGKELLKALVAHGVKCTYVLINAVSYVMKEV